MNNYQVQLALTRSFVLFFHPYLSFQVQPLHLHHGASSRPESLYEHRGYVDEYPLFGEQKAPSLLQVAMVSLCPGSNSYFYASVNFNNKITISVYRYRFPSISDTWKITTCIPKYFTSLYWDSVLSQASPKRSGGCPVESSKQDVLIRS